MLLFSLKQRCCLWLYAVYNFQLSAQCSHNETVVNYSSNTTTVYCQVTINGLSVAGDDELLAYVGTECREIGNIIVNGIETISTLSVQNAGAGETVTFKIWDASECVLIDATSSITVTTNPGTTVGQGNPVLINGMVSNGTTDITLQIGEACDLAGSTLEIPIYAFNFTDVEAFQFTIMVDPSVAEFSASPYSQLAIEVGSLGNFKHQ